MLRSYSALVVLLLILLSGGIAFITPLGPQSLSRDFLLTAGQGTLTLLGLLLSVVVVVSQLGSERGRVDLSIVLSGYVRTYGLLLILATISCFALSHAFYIALEPETPTLSRLCLTKLGGDQVFSFLCMDLHIAQRFTLFMLVSALLFLIPVAFHMYNRIRPDTTFGLIGESLVRSSTNAEVQEASNRLRDHLLAYANPSEIAAFQSGLFALENSAREIVNKSRLKIRDAKTDAVCSILLNINEISGSDVSLIQRIVRTSARCVSVLSHSRDQGWALKGIVRIRQLLEWNLVRWCNGEMEDTAGIRTVRAYTQVAETCSNQELRVSFAQGAISLRKCVEQMLATDNRRGLTASFSSLTDLATLALKSPSLNLGAISQELASALESLVESDERPLLPSYRVREMAEISLEILSPRHGELEEITTAYANHLIQLEQREFRGLLRAMVDYASAVREVSTTNS